MAQALDILTVDAVLLDSARRAAFLTPMELAEKAKVTRALLSKMRVGSPVTLRYAKRVAAALCTDLNALGCQFVNPPGKPFPKNRKAATPREAEGAAA